MAGPVPNAQGPRRVRARGGTWPETPLLSWCALWSAAVLNRVKVQENGRTAYDLYTGHLAKVPRAAFAEKILWRAAGAVSGAGKYDSEWAEGIFVGISWPQVVIRPMGFEDPEMSVGLWTETVGIRHSSTLVKPRSHRI